MAIRRLGDESNIEGALDGQALVEQESLQICAVRRRSAVSQ
jgi:hypothetical protein